jgi:hypothetical protein
MWTVTRRLDRRYRCDHCGQGVDALSAEVRVWELATRARPRLGGGLTPYAERRQLLLGCVSRVHRVGGGVGFRLHWLPTCVAQG